MTQLEKALLALSKLNKRFEDLNEPIAVIGMDCRFPGANSLSEMWQLLRDGKEAITKVPASRWDAGSYYSPDPAAPGKIVTVMGGFLENIDAFDAGFFNISEREAQYLDPQQRLLLETTWHALENAGINSESLRLLIYRHKVRILHRD